MVRVFGGRCVRETPGCVREFVFGWVRVVCSKLCSACGRVLWQLCSGTWVRESGYKHCVCVSGVSGCSEPLRWARFEVPAEYPPRKWLKQAANNGAAMAFDGLHDERPCCIDQSVSEPLRLRYPTPESLPPECVRSLGAHLLKHLEKQTCLGIAFSHSTKQLVILVASKNHRLNGTHMLESLRCFCKIT